MDKLLTIQITELASIITVCIAVANGVNGYFNISKQEIKKGVIFAVCAVAYGVYMFQDIEVVKHIATFGAILFGATGIYDFIPRKEK